MCENVDVYVCQCRCYACMCVKRTLTSSRCSTVVPICYFQMVIAVLYCIFDNAGLDNFTDDCNVRKVKGSFRDGVDLPAGVK